MSQLRGGGEVGEREFGGVGVDFFSLGSGWEWCGKGGIRSVVAWVSYLRYSYSLSSSVGLYPSLLLISSTAAHKPLATAKLLFIRYFLKVQVCTCHSPQGKFLHH